MQAAFAGTLPVERARDDGRGRRRAPGASRSPGDAVVLSPACSSFDMFRDYAHRAEVFRAAVARVAAAGARRVKPPAKRAVIRRVAEPRAPPR